MEWIHFRTHATVMSRSASVCSYLQVTLGWPFPVGAIMTKRPISKRKQRTKNVHFLETLSFSEMHVFFLFTSPFYLITVTKYKRLETSNLSQTLHWRWLSVRICDEHSTLSWGMVCGGLISLGRWSRLPCLGDLHGVGGSGLRSLFSCGITQCGNSLISVFQGSFASIGRVFILVGEVGWALGYYSMGF